MTRSCCFPVLCSSCSIRLGKGQRPGRGPAAIDELSCILSVVKLVVTCWKTQRADRLTGPPLRREPVRPCHGGRSGAAAWLILSTACCCNPEMVAGASRLFVGQRMLKSVLEEHLEIPEELCCCSCSAQHWRNQGVARGGYGPSYKFNSYKLTD